MKTKIIRFLSIIIAATALVGDESNHHQYEKPAVQQRIAQQEFQAAGMRPDAALGWHGAYGLPEARYGGFR